MKNSTQKSIRNLSIAILAIGGVALIFAFMQMIAQLGSDSAWEPVNWNPDIKGWQVSLIVGRFVCVALLFALCAIFLYRTNKGLKEGDFFPRSNVSVIRWTALVAALLAFVRCNYYAMVQGESVLALDFYVFLAPLTVLLFAGLYKLAYLAAKDSKLAI